MAGIGTHWASAANTPWRWWKREQYQGGTHTPFLISWPGHMGNRGGTMNADVADIVDVTPTLLDLAHVTPDTSRSEEHTSELQSLMRNSYAVSCLEKKTNIR